MQPVQTQSFDTAEAAREFIEASGPGRILVLAPETLEQIQNAEDAGGFEGGQTGGIDGGVSQEGDPGPDSSSASEAQRQAPLDLDSGVNVGALFEGVAEIALTLRDVVEAIKGAVTGPVLLVPMRELRRLMGEAPTDEA